MSSKTDNPDREAPRRAGDKAARLAEALRANLHRRKQQARARAAGAAQDEGDRPDNQDEA